MHASCDTLALVAPKWGPVSKETSCTFWKLIVESALRSRRIFSDSLVGVYMLVMPRSVRVSRPRCCTVTVTTTASCVGSLPLNSGSAAGRRRLSDGKIHLVGTTHVLCTTRSCRVYRSGCGWRRASVGTGRRWHGDSGRSSCRLWRFVAAKELLCRRAERRPKVALTVLLLHHSNRPLLQVDWRTLRGLQERIRIK